MTKQELIEKLELKETQLLRAQSESEVWNRGKYKKSSNAEVSKIFVRSLQSEIQALRRQISEIESKNK
ncbi:MULTISPECIES: hypothetical protein [Vibrio harveyi group]|nr:hypothetical protein [Vibrio parahaemolyticus]EJG0664872.1 hypothetical protein [Vibrio parahaemolyticus]ELB2177720.1 hypothetical protein [Vibrio parahaemolyticus]MDA0390503.1 hypothetical protein [Vibrio parahaemolyticus]MDA0395061.1 hypothetical protein [Vibrio parahaemolyticus]MDA0399603.1 hypothetical protein [Vibrio parahaemolyticus]